AAGVARDDFPRAAATVAGGSLLGRAGGATLSCEAGRSSAVFFVAGAAAGAGGAGGSLPAWGRDFSLGGFGHAPASWERPWPNMPSVRSSAWAPQAARMAATRVTRRVPAARLRVTTAQATKARHKAGME